MARPSAPSRRTYPPGPLLAAEARYAKDSARPLHILAFLLPLVVLYELGLVLFLSSPDGAFRETILAHKTLDRFFSQFGATKFYLPGIALVVVLLIWHVAKREPWKVRFSVLAGMAAESVLWMLPLLVLGMVLSMDLTRGVSGGGGGAGAVVPVAMAVAGGEAAESWQAKVTLSIGAGLYEELLFRLVLVTGLHFVTFDLIRMKEPSASIIAVAGGAIAFAVYHNVSFMNDPVSASAFYVVAGLYFGLVFMLRGFGVVVGCHAAYDLMALVIIPILRAKG